MGDWFGMDFLLEVGSMVNKKKTNENNTTRNRSCKAIGRLLIKMGVIGCTGLLCLSCAQWEPIFHKSFANGSGASGGAEEYSIHGNDVDKNLMLSNQLDGGDYFVGLHISANGADSSRENPSTVESFGPTDSTTALSHAEQASVDAPVITAADRWFTLSEAKTGVITLAELMSTATAEDNDTDFAEKGLFTILDYSMADFRSFTSGGSTTVTYAAEDASGNRTQKTVTIHIVDNSIHADDTSENAAKSRHIRFIDKKYFLNESGDFLSEADGGFHLKSKWVTDSSYSAALMNTLWNNRREAGWSTTPAYSFRITWEARKVMKDFIETYGPGAALLSFYNSFLR